MTIDDIYFLTKLLNITTQGTSRLIFDKQGFDDTAENKSPFFSELDLYVHQKELPADLHQDIIKPIIIRSVLKQHLPETTHVIYNGGIGNIIRIKGSHEYYCIIPKK